MNAELMNEKGFGGLDEAVREACSKLRLLAYHTRDSRKSAPGFPDWMIFVQLPRPCLIVAELKREKSRPTEAQGEWLDSFLDLVDPSGFAIEVYLWRPSHWLSGVIMDRLSGKLLHDRDGVGRWYRGGSSPVDPWQKPRG